MKKAGCFEANQFELLQVFSNRASTCVYENTCVSNLSHRLKSYEPFSDALFSYFSEQVDRISYKLRVVLDSFSPLRFLM